MNRFSALHVEDSSLDDDGEGDDSVDVYIYIYGLCQK